MFILSTILGIFDVLGTLKEINRTIYDQKDYYQGTEIYKQIKKDQLENKDNTDTATNPFGFVAVTDRT